MNLCCLAPAEIQSNLMNTVHINDYEIITIGYLGIEAHFFGSVAKLNAQTKGFECCALEVFSAPLLYVTRRVSTTSEFFVHTM
jgi:hypothetical protein